MHPRLPRSLVRPLVAAAAIAGIVTLASPADAARRHVRLVRSSPPADSVVETAPRQLQLWFSEAIALPVSRVRLESPGATAVNLVPLARDTSVAGAPVTAPLPASLADGSYTVQWSTASADGHVVRGSFVFTVRHR